MNKLSDLPNIGEIMEQKLISIGINTEEEIRARGSKEVFIQIRKSDPSACINMLYGIQGAIENINDSHLSNETKQELKMFYNKVKSEK